MAYRHVEKGLSKCLLIGLALPAWIQSTMILDGNSENHKANLFDKCGAHASGKPHINLLVLI
jgi:hypothetical protein